GENLNSPWGARLPGVGIGAGAVVGGEAAASVVVGGGGAGFALAGEVPWPQEDSAPAASRSSRSRLERFAPRHKRLVGAWTGYRVSCDCLSKDDSGCLGGSDGQRLKPSAVAQPVAGFGRVPAPGGGGDRTGAPRRRLPVAGRARLQRRRQLARRADPT